MSPALKFPPMMIGTSESRLSNCSPSWSTESGAWSLGGRYYALLGSWLLQHVGWSSSKAGVCRCTCWLQWLGKMKWNSSLAVVLCCQDCCDLSGETMLVSRRQSHLQVWMPGARICCALWCHKNGRWSLQHFATCTWCSSTTHLLFPHTLLTAWIRRTCDTRCHTRHSILLNGTSSPEGRRSHRGRSTGSWEGLGSDVCRRTIGVASARS